MSVREPVSKGDGGGKQYQPIQRRVVPEKMAAPVATAEETHTPTAPTATLGPLSWMQSTTQGRLQVGRYSWYPLQVGRRRALRLRRRHQARPLGTQHTHTQMLVPYPLPSLQPPSHPAAHAPDDLSRKAPLARRRPSGRYCRSHARYPPASSDSAQYPAPCSVRAAAATMSCAGCAQVGAGG